MKDQIKALTVVGKGRTKAQAEADARERGQFQFASVAPQMLPGCEYTHLRYDGQRFCGLRVQVRIASPKPSERPKDRRADRAPTKPSRRSPQPKAPEGSAKHGGRHHAKPTPRSDLAAAKRLGRLLQEVATSGSPRKLDGGGTYGDFLEVIRDVALYGWVPEDGWDDAALDAIRGLYWWVRDEYLAVSVLGGTSKPQPEVGDELLRLADAVIVGGVAPDKAARKLMQLAEKLCQSAETATAGPQGASGFLPEVPERQHGLRQDDAERIGSTCVEAATSPEGRLRRRPSQTRACPTGTVQTPETSRRGGDGRSYRAKNRFSQKDDQVGGFSGLHVEHKGGSGRATTVHTRYLDAYHRLSLDGTCDGAGGMECRRVFSEWVAAGFPGDLEQFIDVRANAGPWDRAPQAAEHDHVQWFNRKLDEQLKACKGDDRMLHVIDTEEVAERLRYGDGSDGPSGWSLRRIAPRLILAAGEHSGWRWKLIEGTVFMHSERVVKAVLDEVTRRYSGVARKPLSATVVLIDADDEGKVAVTFGDLAEKLAAESDLAKHCREVQWREPGPAKVQTRRATAGLRH